VNDLRVGLGFDVHPAGTGRPLFLGGIHFEGEAGLAGHSDGDVVCHSVASALLGAVALGDLGEHFPDTDPAFEGIAGLDLLGRVVSMIHEKGVVPRSCDLTVIAERPRIGTRRDEIRRTLATALDLPNEVVSVKATRPEGLGLVGDGAACLAVVTVGPAQEKQAQER
jgi:2-C-methyl-D-erythritol 2,4-cyclodiphosphate synthase